MRSRFDLKLWWVTLAVGLSCTLVGCASKRVDALTGRGLIELDEAWAAAAEAGEIEMAMRYWDEHAVMYAPDLPPLHGRDAIRELLENRRTNPGHKIKWTPCCAGIEKDGSLAYTLGEGKVTLVDNVGALREHSVRYVAIWRKKEDGWRCVVKSWTPSPLDSIESP